MARRAKNFEMWCQENDRKELLQEWNEGRNSKMRFSMSPQRIEYNTPLSAYWKCKAGHEWSGPVVARTLFGRKCPICDPKMVALPIGTKYGCLTIIGDYSVYEKEDCGI